MPAPTLAEVDHARVTSVNLSQGASQSIGRAGNRNQMHVVRHQAVRPNLDVMCTAPLTRQIQIRLIILITKERLLPTVSPLRDMVRKAGSNDTR